MKEFVSITLSALFAVFALSGASAQQTPVLRFGHDVWDFGDIREEGGKVEHTFTFTNTADHAVVLEHVATSCGCTTPEYSKSPIMPGKSSEIKVIFDPDLRPGIFSKEVYITSNAGKSQNKLTIKGRVIGRPRSIEDDYPYQLGDAMRFSSLSGNMRYAPHGKPSKVVIGYVNTSGKAVSLGFETSPTEYIKVDAPRSVCAGCKGEITITVNIPAGKMYGKYSYRVLPLVNGRSEKPGFTITGIAIDDPAGMDRSRAPSAAYSAYFHNFGNVKKGTRQDRDFTLTNNGSSPLIVRHVDLRQGLLCTLKAGTTIQPGKSATFKLTLDTAGQKGVFTQVVSIITNDPERPMREIRLAATVE